MSKTSKDLLAVESITRTSQALDASSSARAKRGRSKVGLALAGGGPLGAIWEIGALAALAESLEGIDLTDLDCYVGVSAGGFLAAGLVNGITPRQMCSLFIENEAGADEALDPGLLVRPAYKELAQRIAQLPPLAFEAALRYWQGQSSAVAAIGSLAKALPTGIFTSEKAEEVLIRLFSKPGRSNDFRQLKKPLVIVATDLNTSTPVEFGSAGFDHVPISLAMRASAALPGLFPPVHIDGRAYVDGALRKTLHASSALKQGCKLVLCVNPLVPLNATPVKRKQLMQKHKRGQDKPTPSLEEGGLVTVLSQTFRAIIRSRMETGLARYAVEYPQSDVIVFEPDHHDAQLFFSNVFSYSNRRQVCEQAYQHVRRHLWEHRHELARLLEPHGVHLNVAALRDRSRTLVEVGRVRSERISKLGRSATDLKDTLDDLQRWLQLQEKLAKQELASQAKPSRPSHAATASAQ